MGVYSEHRVFAKSLAFGLNYGMEANTLAEAHGRDIEEVEDVIMLYFEKYVGIHNFMEDIKKKVLDPGYFVLPETKRRRRFTQAERWFNSEFSVDCRKREFDISECERQMMNFPIQGYANEIYTQGKLKLYEEMKKQKMKSRIMISIHDGMVGEGPKEEMKQVKKLAEQCLVKTLGKGPDSVELAIDFDLFDRWYGKKLELESL